MKNIFIIFFFTSYFLNAQSILTKTGYRSLDSVSVGDSVLAYDLFDGHIFYNAISEIKKIDESHNVPDRSTFFDVVINDSIKLFYSQSIWRNLNVCHASELEIGDTIYNGSDNDIIISSIRNVLKNDFWYRLEVSGDHSYIVDNITLHNASRYWVAGGSTTNWNATGNTNWSATSGGANNASIPHDADNAFYDANSGSGTSVLNITANCTNLTTTGYTGTIYHNAGVSFTCYGNLLFSATMSYTYASSYTSYFQISNNAGSNTSINSGSHYFAMFSTYAYSTGYIILASDIFITTDLMIGGHFNSGNFNINTYYLTNKTAVPTDLILGSSKIYITGLTILIHADIGDPEADPIVEPTYVSCTAGTSEIIFNNTSSSNKNFYNIYTGADINNTCTFNNITFTGTGTGNYYIEGLTGHDFLTTFNTVKDDNTSAHTFFMSAGQKLTCTNFNVNGFDSSHKISFVSGTPSSPFYLVKSTGTVNCYNLSITDNHASGGATFNAINSIDGGGNTGWNFISGANTSAAAFFRFMK